MEVLSKGDALMREIAQRSWSQGRWSTPPSWIDHAVTHQHRHLQLPGQVVAHPDLAGALDLGRLVKAILLEHQFPHLAVAARAGCAFCSRVRCACSPPVCCTEPTCS